MGTIPNIFEGAFLHPFFARGYTSSTVCNNNNDNNNNDNNNNNNNNNDNNNKQLNWVGHVQRMDEERLPRKVLEW